MTTRWPRRNLGFAGRLHGLAQAAATEQLAWEEAERTGLRWRPVPGAERAEPPYELRAGTGRRGPDALWASFDAAVAGLNRAIAGHSAGAVAAAFGEMSAAAAALATAVEREDAMEREAQERTLSPRRRLTRRHRLIDYRRTPMPQTPRSLTRPNLGAKRAVVIGGGSFGTAIAVLLARSGMRTTLLTRTEEQAARLQEERENRDYLSGVELPKELRIDHVGVGVARADWVFLGVPSSRLNEAIDAIVENGLSTKASVISLAKGLVAPDGTPPTVLLGRRFGNHRVACIGGPAHAREMERNLRANAQ